MGFLSKFFGKEKQTVNTPVFVPRERYAQPVFLKIPEYAQDVVLLLQAEKYRIDETNFPNSFRSEYGIGFPKERLTGLKNRGLLRVSTASEALPSLKSTELSEIAKSHGIKSSGKKEDVCERIASGIPEEELNVLIPTRYWRVTDQGKAMIEEYPYVEFYMEKHQYSLSTIGMDFASFCNLFSNNSTRRVRDPLWGEFNRLSLVFYAEGSKNGTFRQYSDLLRVMALFLEEEERHIDALSMYARYIHYHANFDAGLSALKTFSYTRQIDSSADMLFVSAEILPFMAKEITTIGDGCGFGSEALRNFFLTAFQKETDEGVFQPNELASFVMCGLNGDRTGQKEICLEVMKSVYRKVLRS